MPLRLTQNTASAYCSRLLKNGARTAKGTHSPLEINPKSLVATGAWSRRQLLLAGCALLSNATIFSGNQSYAAPPLIRLSTLPASETDRLTRVRIVGELTGEIRLKNTSQNLKEPFRTQVIESKSTLDYEEEFARNPSESKVFSSQYFHEATAENRIGNHASKISLRDGCRQIVKRIRDDDEVTNSPTSPLTQSERDLVEGVLATAHLDKLVSDRELKKNDQWEVEPEIARQLLRLDSIQLCNLQVKLVGLDQAKGQLEIDGKITASAHGVPTSLTVQGKGQWDRETKLMSWLALAIEETREISQSEPGFKILARLRILRAPLLERSSTVTLAEMQTSEKNADDADVMRFRSEEGYYQFLADDRWHTISDDGAIALMRMIHKNKVIAQCNLTSFFDPEPGRSLTLEAFKQDIRNSLATSFTDFVDAVEQPVGNGLRMLRVVSFGHAESIPVQWINILLSDDSGRFLSLVYTMNAETIEKFGDSDMQMAGSVEFLSKPATSEDIPRAAGIGASSARK